MVLRLAVFLVQFAFVQFRFERLVVAELLLEAVVSLLGVAVLAACFPQWLVLVVV